VWNSSLRLPVVFLKIKVWHLHLSQPRAPMTNYVRSNLIWPPESREQAMLGEMEAWEAMKTRNTLEDIHACS